MKKSIVQQAAARADRRGTLALRSSL